MLPDGVSARQGAAAFINPLTALGMVETMRREGHRALVHTAAASNLGQMLNRLCIADGVPLVNIVRSPSQVALLRAQGAAHVLDSSAFDFQPALLSALEETGATLAFDAIGGGPMANTLLSAMETVATRQLSAYSRYGSPTHKQVYIYGVLDPSPRILDGQFGMAWGLGGWLMTWFYDRVGPVTGAALHARAAAELTTTFASQFSAETGLAEMLSLDTIRSYTRVGDGAYGHASRHAGIGAAGAGGAGARSVRGRRVRVPRPQRLTAQGALARWDGAFALRQAARAGSLRLAADDRRRGGADGRSDELPPRGDRLASLAADLAAASGRIVLGGG